MLLRPGWIAAGLLVAAFSAACFTVLAPWQFGKSETADMHRELLDRADLAAPVALDQLQPLEEELEPSLEWRAVTVSGRYLSHQEILVPHRMGVDGTATHVVTPLRVAGSGAVILVNRGTISPDAAPADAPPAGDVTVTAQLRPAEEASRYSPPRLQDGAVEASAIDPAQLAGITGLALAPFHLQLSPGQPGALGEIPARGTGSTLPYFSYGVQWLALGAAAPIALGALAVSAVRREREDRGARPVPGG